MPTLTRERQRPSSTRPRACAMRHCLLTAALHRLCAACRYYGAHAPARQVLACPDTTCRAVPPLVAEAFTCWWERYMDGDTRPCEAGELLRQVQRGLA